MPAQQGRFVLCTIPAAAWSPPTGEFPIEGLLRYLKGQQEMGASGFHHWQVLAAFKKKVTITRAKLSFCAEAHIEFTRSEAADDYVHKDDTAVPGTRFEIGTKAIKRQSCNDWQQIWDDATTGNLGAIPADIRIRSYHTLKRIAKDHAQAEFRPSVSCSVFWGVTGSGKSHKMFEDAGPNAYIKSSTTKWWDGYSGQETVILDEFRGNISIEHMLKWLDKYPCYVEEKGGQLPLRATRFYIASNLDPRQWWVGLDKPTIEAFLRRVHVTHFPTPFNHLITQHQLGVGTQVENREVDDPGWLDNFINGLFE